MILEKQRKTIKANYDLDIYNYCSAAIGSRVDLLPYSG